MRCEAQILTADTASAEQREAVQWYLSQPREPGELDLQSFPKNEEYVSPNQIAEEIQRNTVVSWIFGF